MLSPTVGWLLCVDLKLMDYAVEKATEPSTGSFLDWTGICPETGYVL